MSALARATLTAVPSDPFPQPLETSKAPWFPNKPGEFAPDSAAGTALAALAPDFVGSPS